MLLDKIMIKLANKKEENKTDTKNKKKIIRVINKELH